MGEKEAAAGQRHRLRHDTAAVTTGIVTASAESRRYERDFG
jgi:hypothetical protein